MPIVEISFQSINHSHKNDMNFLTMTFWKHGNKWKIINTRKKLFIGEKWLQKFYKEA